MEKRVDQSAQQVNQASIIALLVVAFVLGEERGGPWLVLAVGAAMTVGTLFPRWHPFRLLYWYALRPLGLLKPRPVPEDPNAPRFALGLGAATLWVSSLVYWVVGAPLAAWALAWVVVALAGVNLLLHF